MRTVLFVVVFAVVFAGLTGCSGSTSSQATVGGGAPVKDQAGTGKGRIPPPPK